MQIDLETNKRSQTEEEELKKRILLYRKIIYLSYYISLWSNRDITYGSYCNAIFICQAFNIAAHNMEAGTSSNHCKYMYMKCCDLWLKSDEWKYGTTYSFCFSCPNNELSLICLTTTGNTVFASCLVYFSSCTILFPIHF